MPIRQCRNCGKLFNAQPPMQRYCSDSCRKAGYNALNRKYRRLRKETLTISDSRNFTDLRVIKVGDQERIEAIVALEKAIKEGKFHA